MAAILDRFCMLKNLNYSCFCFSLIENSLFFSSQCILIMASSPSTPSFSLRFQTWDKWLRCLLNISECRALPHPTVPACQKAPALEYPAPTLNFSRAGGCAPPPCVMQPFWLQTFFVPLDSWLLDQLYFFSFFFLPPYSFTSFLQPLNSR